jgi:hypothetical protein
MYIFNLSLPLQRERLFTSLNLIPELVTTVMSPALSYA